MEHQKKTFKYLISMIYIVIGILLIIIFFIYSIQQRRLFYPEKLPDNYEFSFEGHFQEKNFKIKESAIINALHFYADSSKGVVYYLHGNAGSLRTWGFISEIFLENNYDVLIIDYRTFGKSKGKLHEKALYSDAEYIYDELKKEYLEKDIIVYGRSIGTGIATYVASKNIPGQLILEAPYFNILSLIRQFYPRFPKYILRYKIPTYKFLQAVNCPVTIFHGTSDEIVFFSQSLKLKEFLKENDKLIPIVKGHHNDLLNFEEYTSGMKELLKD